MEPRHEFRVFVKNKMFYYDDSDFLIALNGTVLCTHPHEGADAVNWNGDFMVASECTVREPRVVMMRIGLPDMDGKKAFNGDIVVYDRLGGKYIVKYDEQVASFYLHGIPCINTPSSKCGSCTGCLAITAIKNCRIIGNIYENPELLQREE